MVESFGTAGVTPDRAVAILGDAAFIDMADWGIVERSWEDRDLFGYVYGGGCSTVSFESAEGVAMRQLWVHRQALLRVKQLRMHWAEGLRLGWGLVVCGQGDNPWIRRVGLGFPWVLMRLFGQSRLVVVRVVFGYRVVRQPSWQSAFSPCCSSRNRVVRNWAKSSISRRARIRSRCSEYARLAACCHTEQKDGEFENMPRQFSGRGKRE